MHALTSFAGVSQPASSKHLSILKHAELVLHRPNGWKTHHRVQAEALEPIVQWLRDYGAFWKGRFPCLLSWRGWNLEPIGRTNAHYGD